MCWDMGDYLLASGTTRESLEELRKWRDVVEVIHVHNVKVTPEKYYWLPVHPSFEQCQEFFTIEPLLLEAKQMVIFTHANTSLAPKVTLNDQRCVPSLSCSMNCEVLQQSLGSIANSS